MAASATLASKLRADDSVAMSSRSRSGTPDRVLPSTPTKSADKLRPQSPKSLSPGRSPAIASFSVVGVKRKVDDNVQEASSLENLEGTPPAKKVVLSAA